MINKLDVKKTCGEDTITNKIIKGNLRWHKKVPFKIF